MKKYCEQCSKEYNVLPYRINKSKFCSHICYSENLKGKSSWNKGKELTKEHKLKLRDAKLKNPVRYWKGKHTTQGENHYNWKGGVTPINEKVRKSMEYKLWRKAVYERDNYTCVFCGEVGRDLHADHIKPFSLYPELRFAIDNGRTLCINCHRKTDTWGYNVKFYKEK